MGSISDGKHTQEASALWPACQVSPLHMQCLRSVCIIACMSSRTNTYTGIRLVACISTNTYMLHGQASTSLPACQVTLAYIQKASVTASIHERPQCFGQHVKSHQHVAWESNTFIACVSSHTNLCIESIGVMGNILPACQGHTDSCLGSINNIA